MKVGKRSIGKINFKKALVSFLAAATIFTSFSPVLANPVTANPPATIYQRNNAKPIASGVTHEHIQRFTTLGWWNINVLRINLEDPFTNVKGMISDSGVSKRDRVSSMVNKSNAVGGVNGDFFFYDPVPGSLGALINDGEIISARAEHAAPLPGIFIDVLNNAKIDYLKRETIATNLSTGKSIKASAVNSIIPDFSNAIILTSKWGEKSIGTKYHNDLVEVLIVDNKVAQVGQGQPAITIPENGYVIATRGEYAGRLMNFNIGDPIQFTMNSNIDINNTKFAIGGGSYVLKDGQLRQPDTASGGNQPRTGMGISKDGKELILVTIDGRGTSFKGVSQEIFGTILRDLGAYNGLNLDGGGSTTMAIKPVGSEKAEIVNTPSDGSERYVVNGVGVYNNAPIDKLSYLKVSSIDQKMFPNTSRRLEIKGYDKHHNKVEFDPEKITYHFDESKGTMVGNSFKALAPGNVKVTVHHEDARGEIDFKVLNEPTYIGTEAENLYLEVNSEEKLPMFYGKDIDGVKTDIYPEDLSFQLTGNLGTLEGSNFRSGETTGAGALTAKLGSGVSTIKVFVGNTQGLISGLNSLSNVNFSGYPSTVAGSIGPDHDFKVGHSSIRLSYDFSKGDATRAAYINFTNEGKVGMPLASTPTKLGLWVKGDSSGSWLRGVVADSKGTEHIVDFSKNINWTGWEFKTANIPGNISYPIKLNRIYVVETDSAKKTVSEISIDGLTGYYPPSNLGDVQVPPPSEFKDRLNTKKEVEESGYSFGVSMEPKGINQIVGYDALAQVKQKMHKNDLSVFLNGLSTGFVNNLKSKPLYDASGKYNSRQHKDTLLLHLNTSAKGIRASDPKQWNHMFYSVGSSDSNNIVVLLDSPVWGNGGFSDPLEADLLHEYLLETKDKGKKVFVVHGGSSNTSLLKDGIRYIGLDTRPIKNPEDIYRLSSINFVVNGSEVTYNINPLFTK